ncbi:MAG: septum formation initiator family protein [Cryomorphaceae bacterium]|nr:septum formation initiator family protein [Cryomorphaceae bacterium]
MRTAFFVLEENVRLIKGEWCLVFSYICNMFARLTKRIRHLRNQAWFRIISNRYVLMTLAFSIWMTFLDIHSCQVHREIDREMADIESSVEYYKEEIAKDEEMLFQLQSNTDMLETFAREQYFLRRPNEEIYIVEE